MLVLFLAAATLPLWFPWDRLGRLKPDPAWAGTWTGRYLGHSARMAEPSGPRSRDLEARATFQARMRWERGEEGMTLEFQTTGECQVHAWSKPMNVAGRQLPGFDLSVPGKWDAEGDRIAVRSESYFPYAHQRYTRFWWYRGTSWRFAGWEWVLFKTADGTLVDSNQPATAELVFRRTP